MKYSLPRARLSPTQAVWQHEVVHTSEGVGIRFEHDSPDGEGGFPGALSAKVRLGAGDDNRDWRAEDRGAEAPQTVGNDGYGIPPAARITSAVTAERDRSVGG